jgi:hypothetical protein
MERSGSVQIITDPDRPKTYGYYGSGTLLYKLNAALHKGYPVPVGTYLKNVNHGTDSYLGPLNYLNLLAGLAGPHQLNHLLPCKYSYYQKLAFAVVTAVVTLTTELPLAPPPMTPYFPRQPWRVIPQTCRMTTTVTGTYGANAKIVNIFIKNKIKSILHILTINVPLFKKLRDIIFFCGTITF